MNWMIAAGFVLIISAVVLVKLLQQKRESEPIGYPYQKERVLFSPAERSFLGVLSLAVGENAKIFAKVRVADVVTPKKGLSRSDWQKAFNKISRKHFDFLLCSNDKLSVICAIELDDNSHNSKSRQKRDEFLNKVCDVAGIPLIRIAAKASYAIDDIKQPITQYLDIKESTTPKAEQPSQEPVKDIKICRKCSSPMVKRVAKKGRNAGKQFWACSAFPKCRYVEAING